MLGRSIRGLGSRSKQPLSLGEACSHRTFWLRSEFTWALLLVHKEWVSGLGSASAGNVNLSVPTWFQPRRPIWCKWHELPASAGCLRPMASKAFFQKGKVQCGFCSVVTCAETRRCRSRASASSGAGWWWWQYVSPFWFIGWLIRWLPERSWRRRTFFFWKVKCDHMSYHMYMEGILANAFISYPNMHR